jgi:hypothetical protein
MTMMGIVARASCHVNTRAQRLHDQTYQLLASAQQKVGRPRNGFEKKDVVLPFTGAVAQWKVSTAFVYPVLASVATDPAGS